MLIVTVLESVSLCVADEPIIRQFESQKLMHWTREPVRLRAQPTIYHLQPPNNADNYSPSTLKPLLATLLANGLGVSAVTFPMGYQPDEASESNLAIRQYYRFAARYGEFLYDLNWHRAPADVMEVEAPNNVFWRGLVFQRQNEPNAKQVVMHLINLDGPAKTTMILGCHAIPDPLRNIPASIRWEPKVSPQIWAISADGDQSARRLPVSRVGEAIRFTVPSLDYWTTVVASTSWVEQLGSNKVKTE